MIEKLSETIFLCVWSKPSLLCRNLSLSRKNSLRTNDDHWKLSSTEDESYNYNFYFYIRLIFQPTKRVSKAIPITDPETGKEVNISASSEKVNQETDSSQDKPRSRQPSESKSHPVPVTQGIDFYYSITGIYMVVNLNVTESLLFLVLLKIYMGPWIELNWPLVPGKNWYLTTFY